MECRVMVANMFAAFWEWVRELWAAPWNWTAIGAIAAIVGILVPIILYRLSKRKDPAPTPPQLEPVPPTPPKSFNNLAEAGQSPNPHFTGRDDVFDKIKETFAKGSTISLTQSISGLGKGIYTSFR